MLELLTTYRRPDGLWMYPLDSPNAYRQNLRLRPADWPWRTLSVRYTTNSQGYRCREFDSIDWSTSILFFGCSNQFGEGVSDEHVASSLVPGGVNLGMGSSDAHFMWINTLRLLDSSIKPRACVYMWPHWSRVMQITQPNQCRLWGPWNTNQPTDWAWPYISTDVHAQKMTQAIHATVSRLWTCPVIHSSYRQEVVDLLGSGCLKIQLVDLARDCLHMGIQSHLLYAQQIQAQLDLIELAGN